MSRRRHLTSKRATSSVIAGAFFLAAMLIVFNALVVISDQYGSNFAESLQKTRGEYERRAERISIFKISINFQKLNLTVSNRGPLTAHLASIWISEWNKTTSNWHRNRSISVYVEPGQTVANIGQNFTNPLPALDPRLTYALRIVTGRGNVFVGTYSPLAGNVSPGFINTGFLTISFESNTLLYAQEGSCSFVSAWDVPGSAAEIVWEVKVVNHGSYDIKLLKWSAMSFVKMTSGSGASSVNQEAFFIVGPNACDPVVGPPDTVQAFTDGAYIIPKNQQNPPDTQTGGAPTPVRFATSTAGGGTTQSVQWKAQGESEAEYVIFMVFSFLYLATPNEQYTQVIPFAGVHFT